MVENKNSDVLNNYSSQAAQLLEMEKGVMEMIATDQPLSDILNRVALNFEANVGGAFCSILLLDKDGQHVRHGAGPSLPDAYNKGIDGEPIGPVAGSCGTAIFRKDRVIVSDIANDPLWINYREFALSFGLKASWSTPIIHTNGLVMGTFAIYYKTVKKPDVFDIELIDRAASQVKIALEQNHRATQLRESEEKYRLLTEAIPDCIIRFDTELRHTYMNPAALKIYGISGEQIIGKTHREVDFAPDLINLWEVNLKFVFQTGKDAHQQFEWKGANGLYYLDWRLSPEFDKDGKVTNVLCVARDITPLKNAQDEIRKREKFLAIVTEVFPKSYLTIIGKKMEVLFIGGEEFFKLNLDTSDFIGKTIRELFERYGDAAIIKAVDAYQRTFQGEAQLFEIQGDNQFLQIKTVPLISEEGTINSILTITENATEKKEAENELVKSELLFKRLTSSVPVAIFQSDNDGRYIYVNEEWTNYSGVEAKYAMGDGWAKCIHPEDKERVWNEWSTAICAKEEFKSEFRFLQQNGAIIWLTAKAVVLYDAQQVPYGYIGMATDISEHKKINEIIEESETRYRSTLERITDGFVALDKDWRYTYMNKRAGEIFKCNPEDMIGKHIREEFPEGVGQRFQSAYEKAMKDQQYVYLEEYYPPYDSWFENHIYPSQGGLSIYFKDVTERKRTEVELHQSNESLELAEEQVGLGSWEVNVESGTRKWSKQLFRLFCFQPTSKPLSFEDLIDHVHPHDREIYREGFTSMMQGVEPNQAVIRTNPEILPLKYLLPSWNIERDENGKVTKFRGTLLDITTQTLSAMKIRESEEKYRTLIEQASDGIFIADQSLRFVQVNSMACKMLGYNNDELLLLTIKDITVVHKDDTPLRLNEIAWGNAILQERIIKRKDGTNVPVEVSATKLKNGNTLSIVRDITERKKVDELIRETTLKLRNLTTHLQNIREEERAALSRDLHDELGQQLTAIKMDLSWLNKKVSSDDLTEKIAETMLVANDAVATIRRINSDLRPTLLDDLGLFPAMEYQAKEFSKRYNISCDLKIELDEPQLDQQFTIAIFRIFQETLTNVAKHAQASNVSVTLKRQKNNLLLIVKDNGRGFNQGDVGSIQSFGILGMTERAMMMNGILEITSKSGKGTTMQLKVPILMYPSR